MTSEGIMGDDKQENLVTVSSHTSDNEDNDDDDYDEED